MRLYSAVRLYSGVVAYSVADGGVLRPLAVALMARPLAVLYGIQPVGGGADGQPVGGVHIYIWARADAIDAMRWVPWVRYSRALSPGLGVVTPPNPGGASDDSPGPVFSLALSIDVESFAWRFSADAPVEVIEG